jgi:hypothetical protein
MMDMIAKMELSSLILALAGQFCVAVLIAFFAYRSVVKRRLFNARAERRALIDYASELHAGRLFRCLVLQQEVPDWPNYRNAYLWGDA